MSPLPALAAATSEMGAPPEMGALPGAGVRPNADASREPAGGQPSPEDAAEQGIWLCGGGELPAPLLAALTGQTPWSPQATASLPDSTTHPSHRPAAYGGPAPGGSGEAGADRPISAGFAQDGVIDGLAPGPELAMFLSDAVSGAALPNLGAIGLTGDHTVPAEGPTGAGAPPSSGADRPAGGGLGVAARGLAGLDDAALTGVLRGWRRLSAWAAAMEHATAAELVTRRITEAETCGCWAEDAGRYAAAEIAAALTLTRTSADTLLGRALALLSLTATATALAAGQIDLPRAAIIADGIACLDQQGRHIVEAQMAAIAPAMTTGELRAAVARAVIAADPSAAEQRRTQAEKQARVEHQPEAGGVTAMLTGRDLPAAESAAAANRITALAAALKRDGATGGMNLLRARVFLGLLLGRPIAAQPTAQGSGTVEGDPAGPRLVPAGGSAAWPLISGNTQPPGGTPGAASINLTVPLTTWLGLAQTPGDLAGYGPVTAATAQRILANTTCGADTPWCLTITSDSGQAIAHGCSTPHQPASRAGTRRPHQARPPPPPPGT